MLHQFQIRRLGTFGMHLDHQGNDLADFFRVDHRRIGLDNATGVQTLNSPLHRCGGQVHLFSKLAQGQAVVLLQGVEQGKVEVIQCRLHVQKFLIGEAK
ncbi:hypothetical protein D3C77_577660 [compost metagenome]